MGAQITANGALKLLAQGQSAEKVLALYGITDPTPEELQWASTITPDLNANTSKIHATLGAMLSKRCNIGWNTIGHTGEDVVLYSYLPGDKRMTGLFENTEIAETICNAWGIKLSDNVCHHKAK